MKNKKGFTLMELIVAIAIMGIITIMAFPAITKVKEKNKYKKYEAYEESLERAAKLYTDSNDKDMFGYLNSGCVRVKYSELKSANLIKDIQEKDTACSNDTETFVDVTKLGNEYKYKTSIICKDKAGRIVYPPNYNQTSSTNCVTTEDNSAPTISVSPESVNNWTQTDNLEDIIITVTDEGVAGLNKNISVKYAWVKDGNTTKNWKTLNFDNRRYEQRVSKPIPYNGLPVESGEYTLYVNPENVVDTLGNKANTGINKGKYRIDNVAPTFNGEIGALLTYNDDMTKLIPGTINTKKIKVCFNSTADDVESVVYNVSYYISSSAFGQNGISGKQTQTVGWNGECGVLTLDGNYDGYTHTIYLSAKDAAGNIRKTTIDYTVYKECTATNVNEMDTSGGYNANGKYIVRLYDKITGAYCRYIMGAGVQMPTPTPTETYTKTTEYGSCSRECGGGIQYEYEVTRDSNGNEVGREKTGGNRGCNTRKCCSSTYYEYSSSWSKCKNGKQTKTCTQYSNYNDKDCGSCTALTKNCQEKTTLDCSTADSTVFGTSKGSNSGNFGAWVNASTSWGNWCHSGGNCYATGGYIRKSIYGDLKGMTAQQVNEETGCNYAKYWCTC